MTDKSNPKWSFWIDRGGTFTDIVALSPDGEYLTAKHLSVNPECYQDAAIHGIRTFLGLENGQPIPPDRIEAVKMGTTVATNALLERAGEKTAFLTTRGFKHVLEIGYQSRPDTFALKIEKPELLYARVDEIEERVLADGTVEVPLNEHAARQTLQSVYDDGIRTVAIAFMHGYKFPAHEQRLAEIARGVGFTQISTSHEVSPLTKIVARGETTLVDAYLTPVLRCYIDQVSAAFDEGLEPGQLLFMQSSGGLANAKAFRGRDAILSGPAGGVIGCVQTARQAGFDNVIGFDMGGTSTDVSHFAGEYEKAYETEVAGVRMRVPMLHIHTVAAGGGSILKYADGRFQVGPESAGADPGPVAYRRGGPLAVTDINVCLGKLQPELFPPIFGPKQDLPLDHSAVVSAFEEIASEIGDGRSIEEVAEGFLDIAVEHMAQAIKKISIARGYDLKGYAMNCFGGAGGQHACLVAEKLGITDIVIHPFNGVLSAYGMGSASITTEHQKVLALPLVDDIEGEIEMAVAELSEQGLQDLLAQGVASEAIQHRPSALVRYQGTDTSISVPVGLAQDMRQNFREAHQRQFGFVADEKTIILDTLAVESLSPARNPPADKRAAIASKPANPRSCTRFYSKGEWHDVPVFELSELAIGQTITGPAIISEPTGTIIIEPGWNGKIDSLGNLVLSSVTLDHKQIEASADCDPAMLEIFNNLYMSIAQQMGIVLRNTSQSVNVKERLDFSCAIFDAQGNLVANAPHVPVHLGSMDASVKTIIASGQSILPGDAFVQNNPHNGGSHLPDITVVSPVFDDAGEEIMFFVASRAHHEDVGGLSPGSMSPRGKTIHDEGVILENLKLVSRGEFQTELIEKALSKGPHPARNVPQNIADLMAQVAANSAGANELRKLVGKYGLEVAQAYMRHIQDAAELAVRRVIKSLAGGAFTIELDSGAKVCVAVRPDRDSGTAVIDFNGSSEQQPNAFNAPKSVTHAAVLYVFRCLIAEDVPLNAGCMKPLEVIVPEGTLLNPRYPAAVVAGNVEISQAATDALFAALGKLGTAQGTMNNLTFGNERFQYYETICSGAPAGPGFDGVAGVHTHMTNTRMTDPEILEKRCPVILEEFRIDRGSGGKGQWNAGDGTTRTIRFLEPVECSILSEHRIVAQTGVAGGQAGRLGGNRVLKANGDVVELGGTGQAFLDGGDRIVITTPTGGGFGPISARESFECSKD